MSDELFKYAVLNASMYVRTNATKRESSCQLVGPVALQAMRGALLEIGKLNPLPSIAGVLMKDMTLDSTGKEFEDEVSNRLALGCLAPRAWLLSSLSTKSTIASLPALREAHENAGFDLEHAKASLREENAATSAGASGQAKNSLEQKTASAGASKQRKASLKKKKAQTSAGASEQGKAFLTEGSAQTSAAETLEDSCQRDEMLWFPMTPGHKPCDVSIMPSAESTSYTYIDARVQEAVRGCAARSSGSVLIHTTESFPGVDFVLFRADGMKRSVIFVESTVSTLSVHGSGKIPAGHSGSPPVFRDMMFLMNKEFLIAKSNDGAWQFGDASSKESGTGGEAPLAHDPELLMSRKSFISSPSQVWRQLSTKDTLANMWLRVLGCPKRITLNFTELPVEGSALRAKMQINIGDAVKCDEWRRAAAPGFEQAQLSTAGAASNILQEADSATLADSSNNGVATTGTASTGKGEVQWDVSVVYVSGKTESIADAPNYANLECDFVYGVFLDDFNDAPKAWLRGKREL
jgi:hypothetical protein